MARQLMTAWPTEGVGGAEKLPPITNNDTKKNLPLNGLVGKS